MFTNKSFWVSASGLFIIIILLAVLMVASINLVSVFPGGESFAKTWLGGQAFLLEGADPYQVTFDRSKTGFNVREPERKIDLPFYLLPFYFPFSAVDDFELARGLWSAILSIALLLTIWLNLLLTRWKLKGLSSAAWFVFGLLWFYAAYSLWSGSHIILTGLLLALVLIVLRNKNDELAGIILALATFNWEIFLLVFIFILYWVIINRRYRVLYGLGMTLIVVIFVATVLWAEWFLPTLRAALFNLREFPGLSSHALLAKWWPGIGTELGWALTVIFSFLLLVEWFAARRGSIKHILWTISLTLVVTPLLGFPQRFENYFLYFLPITVFFSIFVERWGKLGGWLGYLAALGGLMLFWYSACQSNFLQPAMNEQMFFVLPTLLFLALYWVRWWAIRSVVPQIYDPYQAG